MTFTVEDVDNDLDNAMVTITVEMFDGCPEDYPRKPNPASAAAMYLMRTPIRTVQQTVMTIALLTNLRRNLGTCGCNVSDEDSDEDGTPDRNDDCNNLIDSDNDGANDCEETRSVRPR